MSESMCVHCPPLCDLHCVFPPQSVGQLLEVSVDPSNEENMIITFGNKVDAEKVGRMTSS